MRPNVSRLFLNLTENSFSLYYSKDSKNTFATHDMRT